MREHRRGPRWSFVVRLLTLSAILAAGLTTVTAAVAPEAARADSPYTVANERFNGATFPPPGWQVQFSDLGPWAANCAPAAPGGGCFAQATAATNIGASDSMLFNGTAPIPSDLINPVLSFYSDFTTDATTSGDTVWVGQALMSGQSGDFNMLATLEGTGPGSTNDPVGVPTLHTVPLSNSNLPLRFNWTSFGDKSATPTKSWGISNVVISGTLPSTTLTANPIANNVYSPVAGTPVTIHLSGSSNPTGDALNFSIVAQPTKGSLGVVTPVNATHADVVYTAPLTACPDPTGGPMICPDSFTYKVSDGAGNQSTAANVALDVAPGGAGGAGPTITAPPSVPYVTLGVSGGGTAQGSDLSGSVSVGPTNYADEVELHVRAAIGSISIPNANQLGVTLLNGTSSPMREIDMKGSVPRLNMALGVFEYFPPAGTTPTTSIDLYAADLGPTGTGGFLNPTHAVVQVNGPVVNAPPVLTVPTGPLSVATGAGPLTFPPGVATGFRLADAAAAPTDTDTVILSVSGGTLLLPSGDTGGSTAIVAMSPSTAPNPAPSLTFTGTIAHLGLALADLTFDPTALPSGTVTLSAMALDPRTGLQSSPAPVGVPISVVETPYAFGPTATTALENSPSPVFLCGAGPSGDALGFTVTTQPAHGTLTPASNAGSGCSQSTGSVVAGYTYTPATDFVGPDSIGYLVTDTTTGLHSAANTLTVTVTAHAKPTAFPVSASTAEDAAVAIVLCGTNPEQSDGPLTFAVAQAPAFGTVTLVGPATLNICNNGTQAYNATYTPNAGTFTTDGTDGFSYTVSNGSVSDPVYATIHVTTRTPQVMAEDLTVDENGAIGFDLCSTLPGSPFSVSIANGPFDGSLDTQRIAMTGPACPTGWFSQYERYVPRDLYSGHDVIVFRATAGSYTSALGLISITVNKIEIPPTADSQSVTAIAHHASPITLSGVSRQGSPLTYRIVTSPSNGTLSGTAPNLAYTSNTTSGQDSFTFVANDGVADSAPATVTITVVTPRLGSSVCYPGTPDATFEHYACAGALTSVDDGSGGQISLAHTAGTRLDELHLQTVITNQTSAPDTVTLTAPAAAQGWTVLYDVGGADRTADITAGGVVVTLGPAGSPTGTVDVQSIVFPPLDFPAPATARFAVRAVSGNDPTVWTSAPVEVMDGTSRPTLALAQADGTGPVTFPTFFDLAPDLYAGGPAGRVTVIPSLSGTGVNVVRVTAEIESGSASDADVRYIEGQQTDVTNQVNAGTFTMQCYADTGCPPMHVLVTPGHTAGYVAMFIHATSTIDGQGAIAALSSHISGDAGPDLSTSFPVTGNNVFEATPLTQVATTPVELGGSASKTVHLLNLASATDTFTLHAVTTAVGTSSINVQVGVFDNLGNRGPLSDVSAAIAAGTYTLTLTRSGSADIIVTDTAGTAPGDFATRTVVSAVSKLAPSRSDAFAVDFDPYSYRPDAVLTTAAGSQIGAGVYEATAPAANNFPAVTLVNGVYHLLTQSSFYNIGLAPTSVDVSFVERGSGVGSWPTTDAVTVRGPASNNDVVLSYATVVNGVRTDVTSAVTGAGLAMSLVGNGGAARTISVTAAATATSLAGHPTYVDLNVTSGSSIPAGLTDAVELQLYNTGASQLRFAGLPQPEPLDITRSVTSFGLADRVAPFPSAGYAPGATYGAYSDPTGQKFVYASAYDTFGLQLASEKATHTSYRVQLSDPSANDPGLPLWVRYAFQTAYHNGSTSPLPADPSALHPTITVGGVDVTAAVMGGTYTTASLGTNETLDLSVTFSPPAGDSQRYRPLKFSLVNAADGHVEDSLLVGLSSIVTCSDSGWGQQQASIISAGQRKTLNFRSFDRTAAAGATECMQHLSHSWITKFPVVFGSYVPATANSLAGGDSPYGLWLLPQQGSITRINTDTLEVTSAYVKGYVDLPSLGDDGKPITGLNGLPDPATIALYNYVGDYPNLDWNTTSATTGLRVDAASPVGPAPFPLIVPDQTAYPGNTMAAARYFQFDTTTGAPQMVGEMQMNEPWYTGRVAFNLPVDGHFGMLLQYNAPKALPPMSLPGDDSVHSYFAYWTTKKDGAIVQGGCLGLPPEFLRLLSIPSDFSFCLFEVTTTFKPIPADPTQKAQIANIFIDLKNPKAGQLGTPEFNLSELKGNIDLDPTTGQVQQVVLDSVFGVGPPTDCQARQNADAKAGVPFALGQFIIDLPCPSNYFFFDAQVTFKQGGFTSANSTTGYGIKFSGTLSFLGVITLNNIEADISTSPFNFHFEDSPIDLIIPAIPITAKLTFGGDIGALGFDIGVSGNISAFGTSLISASGIVSTKGFGVCGGLLGTSVGFGEVWGASPTLYGSGCTTDQYRVTTS